MFEGETSADLDSVLALDIPCFLVALVFTFQRRVLDCLQIVAKLNNQVNFVVCDVDCIAMVG